MSDGLILFLAGCVFGGAAWEFIREAFFRHLDRTYPPRPPDEWGIGKQKTNKENE